MRNRKGSSGFTKQLSVQSFTGSNAFGKPGPPTPPGSSKQFGNLLGGIGKIIQQNSFISGWGGAGPMLPNMKDHNGELNLGDRKSSLQRIRDQT